MNIPSNFTVEEVLKYYSTAIPSELLDRITAQVEFTKRLQSDVNNSFKVEERLWEQLHFRDDFIRSVVIRCETATNCKDLVAAILTELEESCIEL